MNIFLQLKRDHATINALMHELLVKQSDHDARARLFANVKTELLAHSLAEDDVFYSELENEADLAEPIMEARLDHDMIEDLLIELDQMPIDTQEWINRFKVLKATVDEHIAEEETHIFELARAVFDADDSEVVGRRMDRREAEYRAQV